MTGQQPNGFLHRVYRNRIGEPTTHDEVRGYWVFLTGLVLATVGLLAFLPSESAVGTTGVSIREISILFAAIGLAMMMAGTVIRLPVQPWANYAAYAGQVLCFVAGVWFVVVFPASWSVETGSQPVIVLYAVGLAVMAVGGVIAPLLVGNDKEETQTDDAASAELAAHRESQAQYELYEDAGGEWRWRLRHRNGNIIAMSGEGYTRKHNAQKGLASVRHNGYGADVLLLETETETEDDVAKALAATPILAEDLEESAGTFEVYTDDASEHRWRLVHDNGNVIADSGEGYTRRESLEDAIESVRRSVTEGDYLRFDPVAFQVYRDRAGQWRWRLVHKNGNIIAAASEGYTRRRNAKRALETVRDRAAADEGFEIYEDQREEYRWRLRGGNQEILATSGEGYSDQSGVENALHRVQNQAPDADALDVAQAAFEVYRDAAEEWRWRLRHRNGEILADGGEGYASRTNAHDGIESVKRNAPAAEIAETDG